MGCILIMSFSSKNGIICEPLLNLWRYPHLFFWNLLFFCWLLSLFCCLNLLDCTAAACWTPTLQKVKSLTVLVSYLLSHYLGFAASVFQDHTPLRFQNACMHPWSCCWSLIVSQSYAHIKNSKQKPSDAGSTWVYGDAWIQKQKRAPDVLCSFSHIHSSIIDHLKCQIFRFLSELCCCCCVIVRCHI